MKNTSIIFVVSALIATSFFGCKKVDFNEDDDNIDVINEANLAPNSKILLTQNSDLLSNKIKAIEHQESTGAMWFLTEAGIQSYSQETFKTYEEFTNRGVSEIYFDTNNTFLFNEGGFKRFNTITREDSNATELDWNIIKHGIDFTYRTDIKDNNKIFVVEDRGNISEFDFKGLIQDEIGVEPLNFVFNEVVETEVDSTFFGVIEDEDGKRQIEDLCQSYPGSLSPPNCQSEIGDSIFFLNTKAVLSDGSTMTFSLNEFNETPTAVKFAQYDPNTLAKLNEIGFEKSSWGNVTCWVYPSNEVCSDNFEFKYEAAAMNTNKTIYLRFDDHLVVFKNDAFKAIPYNLNGYNFLLRDGQVYLTNKNTLLKIEDDNRITRVYTSSVDCWVFGNRELQGFTSLENKLWIANCENIVRCQQGNCVNKRVEHPGMKSFELRSNAIEVVNDNTVWIGYNNDGIYRVDWDKL